MILVGTLHLLLILQLRHIKSNKVSQKNYAIGDETYHCQKKNGGVAKLCRSCADFACTNCKWHFLYEQFQWITFVNTTECATFICNTKIDKRQLLDILLHITTFVCLHSLHCCYKKSKYFHFSVNGPQLVITKQVWLFGHNMPHKEH